MSKQEVESKSSAPAPQGDTVSLLQERARQIRRDIIMMLAEAGSGHPGGSLSAADIVACLYFHIMRHDPARPDWPERDRFVLSKGHACPVLYAALAEAGYFPKEQLMSLRKLGSPLQGHPDMCKVPGVEMTTGSLGQGLATGVGMALAAKLDKSPRRIFVMIGDGESQEGQIWEASMAAAHYKLDNLTAILDFNGLQIDGPNAEVMAVQPVADKWKAFGWNVVEIDGHDIPQILHALSPDRKAAGKPTMIIAHTVKGKGVSFMEGVVDFHGKAPNKEQAEKALAELGT
ncbi:MAG: transketolase [Armatimonadetes bacterium]|nr:transketolase [Armatimonadota bacterium]NIM23418.1 transketolase [Armatimonadota bacterium]NIM67283.1 transketolase [Armatimonadota bacterium]NIM75781.1 transketolase [Armatimonadota bacterium]NIN05469.1 transketolase [Armatimonadota bacterium]